MIFNILEKWAHCLTHIIIDILNKKISTPKHQLIQSENCPEAHQVMDRACPQDGGGIHYSCYNTKSLYLGSTTGSLDDLDHF